MPARRWIGALAATALIASPPTVAEASPALRVTTLFRAGHAHARWLVPYSNTGSWSLYSLAGRPSTVEHRRLLRDILSNLCKRIGTDGYRTTADRFTAYLSVDPR